MTESKHIIDVDPTGAVFVDGVATGHTLTRKHEQVLRAIFSHRHVATKEYLMDAVYGGKDEPECKIIDVFVTHIRRKLGPHRGAIVTVWGRGYGPSADYALARDSENKVQIDLSAGLIEELQQITGEPPSDLVTRLLEAERERLWA